MRRERIARGEGPQALSARLGAPVCMLMRANRLACAAWLVPGREINVPEGDFCMKDAFPCPKALTQRPAAEEKYEVVIVREGDTAGSIAQALETAPRMILKERSASGALREGERLLVGEKYCRRPTAFVLPGETAADFCRRTGAEEEALLDLNDLRGAQLLPGMRLILPDGNGV